MLFLQSLQGVSVSVSILTLTFISIDRWYAICHPLRFKCTTAKARLAIFLIWTVSLLLVLPDAVWLQIKRYNFSVTLDTEYLTDCSYSMPLEHTRFYQLMIVVILFLAPFSLMSVAYYQIALVLWNRNIPGERATTHSQRSKTVQPQPSSTDSGTIVATNEGANSKTEVGGTQHLNVEANTSSSCRNRRHRHFRFRSLGIFNRNQQPSSLEVTIGQPNESVPTGTVRVPLLTSALSAPTADNGQPLCGHCIALFNSNRLQMNGSRRPSSNHQSPMCLDNIVTVSLPSDHNHNTLSAMSSSDLTANTRKVLPFTETVLPGNEFLLQKLVHFSRPTSSTANGSFYDPLKPLPVLPEGEISEQNPFDTNDETLRLHVRNEPYSAEKFLQQTETPNLMSKSNAPSELTPQLRNSPLQRKWYQRVWLWSRKQKRNRKRTKFDRQSTEPGGAVQLRLLRNRHALDLPGPNDGHNVCISMQRQQSLNCATLLIDSSATITAGQTNFSHRMPLDCCTSCSCCLAASDSVNSSVAEPAVQRRLLQLSVQPSARTTEFTCVHCDRTQSQTASSASGSVSYGRFRRMTLPGTKVTKISISGKFLTMIKTIN